MLAHVEALEADIDGLSAWIAELIASWQGQSTILDVITGNWATGPGGDAAEIGPDMSWLRPLSTWHRKSAGRKGSTKPRKGSTWLADVLTECSWAAAKTKAAYLPAFYRQIMRRQGN
jgi:transposase